MGCPETSVTNSHNKTNKCTNVNITLSSHNPTCFDLRFLTSQKDEDLIFTPRKKPEVTHRLGLPGNDDVSEERDVSIFRVTELRPNKIIVYLDIKFLRRSVY
jgi:hypothetical protein